MILKIAHFVFYLCFDIGLITVWLPDARGTNLRLPHPSARGPSFVVEPPTVVEYPSNSGGIVDCVGTGNPPPTVSWVYEDGTRIHDIPGVRKTLGNGSLVIYPFSELNFRQDIHSASVRCFMSNEVGNIISRVVKLDAAVQQTFILAPEEIKGRMGCSAILRCVIPSYVPETVRVHSWIVEPTAFIYPALRGDGKRHLLPNGDLLINNLDPTDPSFGYRCKTQDRLTLKNQTSDLVKVKIDTNRVSHANRTAPIFIDKSTVVYATEEESAVLTCLTHSCPDADYSWFRIVEGKARTLTTHNKARPLGPLLAIESVSVGDAGTYRCVASNEDGEVQADMKLVVITSVAAEIRPNRINAPMGTPAAFRCVINSRADNGTLKTIWYKDGTRAPPMGQDPLMFSLAAVGMEDVGMYQCIIRGPMGDVATASAELQLGDSPPIIGYKFIEQTIKSGPATALKCSAAGNPLPQFTWELDGFPLINNSRIVIGQFVTPHGDVVGHLNITQSISEDSGEYTCLAKNRAGTSEHAARFNVYGYPVIRPIPNMTAIAGKSLKIKCPVGGYPIHKIHWERAGTELPQDIRQKVLTDGTLIISTVQKTIDAGSYTCWATNKQGESARRDMEIAVIVPPEISPFQSPFLSLNVGERASMTCSALKGDSPLTMAWNKDKLPIESLSGVNIIQLDEFNSFLSIESAMTNHSGVYTCFLKNSAGEVRMSRKLTVNVPPIIEPFSFQDGLAEGMRTRTVCGVTGGDLPLSLVWLKDGRPLGSDLAETAALDPYSSLLSIPRLAAHHSGLYSCLAANNAAEVTYSARLLVKVPPRWEEEPKDQSVLRGTNVQFKCRAHAVPPANTSWKKAVGNKNSDYVDIKRQPDLHLLPDGTLEILQVDVERQGYYLCQATNGIGTGISKLVTLKVHSPPYFLPYVNVVRVKKGENAVLKCIVNGDSPLTALWRKGLTNITPSGNFRYSPHSKRDRITIKSESTLNGLVTTLHILNVDVDDAFEYTCQITNIYGRQQQTVELVVQQPPLPPHTVLVSDVQSTTMRVRWLHDQRNGDTDTNMFIIEYKEDEYELDNIKNIWKNIDISGNPLQTEVLIEHLRPATLYTIRVTASGPAGKGLPSAETRARTESQRPSGPPTSVQTQAFSPDSILVTWNPPEIQLRHGNIDGYIVGVGNPATPHSAFNFTRISKDSIKGMGEILLEGLDKFTKYIVTVQAYNHVGSGPPSEPVTIQTMEDVPSMPPSNVRCASFTSQSMQISWQPPPLQNHHGNLLGYTVFYEPVYDEDYLGEAPNKIELNVTNGLTTIIPGLSKYAFYSFEILAFTIAGGGKTSSVIRCRTREDVPGAPEAVKLILTSPQSILVAWLPPDEPNGVILNYTLYIRIVPIILNESSDKLHLDGKATAYEISNVLMMAEYQVWLSSSTHTGEGKSSEVQSIIATGKVVPRILSFGRNFVKPRSVSIIMICPAVGFTQRVWLKDFDPIMNMTPDTASGDLILASLQPSHGGNYTCQVSGSMGSDSISYLVMVQMPPGAPKLFLDTTTFTTAIIKWNAPESNFAPIKKYTLSYWPQHDSTAVQFITISSRYTSFELKALNCGVLYSMFMTASNIIGESSSSPTIQVKTQGEPPLAPTTEDFIDLNITSAILRTEAWPNNGCPIQQFLCQYKKKGDDYWSGLFEIINKNYKLKLEPSTRYILRVEVKNDAGTTTKDFEFSTTNLQGELMDIPEDEIFKHTNSLGVNEKVMLALGISITLVFILIIVIGFKVLSPSCRLNSSRMEPRVDRSATQLMNMPGLPQHYNTVHNVSQIENQLSNLKSHLEACRDVTPYATFHISEPARPRQPNKSLALLAYHERGITEPRLPPPPRTAERSPYYQFNAQMSTRRRRVPVELDSDSESDMPQPSFSRAGSSGQQLVLVRPGRSHYMYPRPHSSTSSEVSPPREATLSRRGMLRDRPQPAIAETHFGLQEFTLDRSCRVPHCDRHLLPEQSNQLTGTSSKTKSKPDFSIAV